MLSHYTLKKYYEEKAKNDGQEKVEKEEKQLNDNEVQEVEEKIQFNEEENSKVRSNLWNFICRNRPASRMVSFKFLRTRSNSNFSERS